MSDRVEIEVPGLPESRRGRRSKEAQQDYDFQVMKFVQRILDTARDLDFKVSSRGWCYILENAGLITKGEFPKATRLINDCRKNELLPLDICIEDDRRVAEGVENPDGTIEAEVESWRDALDGAHENYAPLSFWDGKPFYVECAVEKGDLKSLFTKVCDRFRMAITNIGGWADLHCRAAMIERLYLRWCDRQQPILLYCGDHDPGGLNITSFIRKNLRDMAGAVAEKLEVGAGDIEAMLEDLTIDRFGLNYDFIQAQGLTWIDNLETSTGKDLASERHADHFKPYVQAYLQKFGPRKVEANALVVRPEAGRELCLQAILKYLPNEAPKVFEAALKPLRDELRVTIRKKFCLDGHPDEAPPAPDTPPEPPRPPYFRVQIEDDAENEE